MIRLAHATGCPPDKPIYPWLIKRGLVADWQNRVPLPQREVVLDNGVVVVDQLNRYQLTKRGEDMLRFVRSQRT